MQIFPTLAFYGFSNKHRSVSLFFESCSSYFLELHSSETESLHVASLIMIEHSNALAVPKDMEAFPTVASAVH